MSDKRGVGVRLPIQVVQFYDELKERKGFSRNASARMAIKNILQEKDILIDISIDALTDNMELSASHNAHYNLYLPKSSVAEIDALATEMGMTRSDLLRFALIRLMRKLQEKQGVSVKTKKTTDKIKQS